MDGRRRGLLLIGVARCGTTGPPGQPSTVVRRYDVRVVAFVEATRVTSGDPDPGFNGTLQGTVRWTGTWQNVQVSVRRPTPTMFFISANAMGLIRGEFEFADRRPAVACAGTDPINSPARLSVAVSRTSGPTTFGFDTLAEDGIEPSVCPDHSIRLPIESPEATVQGLQVSLYDPLVDVRIKRTGPAGLLFFPIERLRDGQGFSVATGVRSFSESECGYSFCTKTVRFEARVTFTPAR